MGNIGRQHAQLRGPLEHFECLPIRCTSPRPLRPMLSGVQPHPAGQDWSMVGWQEDPYQVVRHQHPYLHHLPLPHCLHVLLLRFSEVREESAWHWTRSSKRHLSHEPIPRSRVRGFSRYLDGAPWSPSVGGGRTLQGAQGFRITHPTNGRRQTKEHSSTKSWDSSSPVVVATRLGASAE